MNSSRLLLLSLGLFFFGSLRAQDPVILVVGDEQISRSEFVRVFKKNNTKEAGFEKKAVDDYLQLYINYKMKVHEALEAGMDTAQSFRDELAGYRKQLAQPYLADKQVTEALVKEAYDRMKINVRASHILIKCDQNALPKDTLEAYNKALKVRAELVKGADFTVTAKKYSEDPSVKDNGGDLGYFTAMQMVYPFETAAYNTKPGEISQLVRTKYGYHIIKVYDVRPNQGEVRVSHIMVKIAAGVTGEDSIKAQQKINEIYGKLKAGEKFEDLARQFSDDQASGKNGGLLPWFGVGRMVPEFEIAAFSLKYPGDYTEPIRTSYGWHIVKLMETKPIPPFESMQAELKQRVQKDSRSDLSKTSMIAKIKARYGFKEVVKARTDFGKAVDSTLSQGTWSAEKAAGLNAVMFTLGSKNYDQQEFATYLVDHQSKRGVSMAPVSMMNALYNEWVDESCISLEESKLDSLYPDFRNLMQEYRDGILLFELMDKKVWSKAVKDTVGLKAFYEANKTKYMWPDRLDASIYTCASADVAKDVHKLMKKIDDTDTLLARVNQSSQLNLQVRSSKFIRGDSDVIDQIEWKPGMTKDMERNGQIVFVVVNKMIPAQPKSIDEAKGIITADYQTTLEKDWIAELHAKYPVKVNQDVVDSLYSSK